MTSTPPSKIGKFARDVLKKPLYPYQEEIGDAILNSIEQNLGLTFTIMMARQMGKNQLSAVLEAYLLRNNKEGIIVKAAPTYDPQIGLSRQRLLQMLEALDLPGHRWKSGHIVGLAPDQQSSKTQSGPRVLFFSAAPGSNIVGATASLLLEIDEAQHVSVDKFNIELRPMTTTTRATTVLYGTAWTDETLLATMKAHNLELERQDGIKRHFEYNWNELAESNPNYKARVEEEIKRLGEDHVTIRTQFRLLPISGEGLLLSELQRHLLLGT